MCLSRNKVLNRFKFCFNLNTLQMWSNDLIKKNSFLMTEKVTFIPIAPVRINLYTINWKNWTADASGPWFYFYVFSLSHTKMFFCSHYPPRIIYSRLQLWAKNIQLWQNDAKTRSSREKNSIQTYQPGIN